MLQQYTNANATPLGHGYNREGYGYADGMTDAQILKSAPAIFAQGKHEARSERYEYLDTSALLSAMRDSGFLPVRIQQQKSRVEDMRGFAKHVIRFRQLDQLALPEAREIVLTNSHNGASALVLSHGLYRQLCDNSLYCGKAIDSVSIRHGKGAIDRTVGGAYSIVNGFAAISEKVDLFKSLQLARPEQLLLAQQSSLLRFDASQEVDANILLAGRRIEDSRATGNDSTRSLWTIYNVIQENLIKGGRHINTTDAIGRRKRRVMRAVNGIDQSASINRGLWSLAEQFAKSIN